MMQKAQVFSLEQNTSVRNRLTHSLEVCDTGRAIARKVGDKLVEKALATKDDIRCIEAIVENACLMHDIGNPPFGHFGEEAIKRWFNERAPQIFEKAHARLSLGHVDRRLYDLTNFDGNPQGFRIVTKLHAEIDEFGLNLTYATLLASIKYPNYSEVSKDRPFFKKLGIFSSEADLYKNICETTGHALSKRYFIVYLVELADDICYCLSDIADAFEKRVVDSRLFKEELKKIFKEEKVSQKIFEEGPPAISQCNSIG
jgi:dGTPase